MATSNGTLPEDVRGDPSRASLESTSTASTTSLVFDRIHDHVEQEKATAKFHDESPSRLSLDEQDECDAESGPFLQKPRAADTKRFRRWMWIVPAVFISAWLLGLVVLLSQKAYVHSSGIPHDPAATASRGHGKAITLDQIFARQWFPKRHNIEWILGPNGEDGLLLERGAADKDYLVVEDVRVAEDTADTLESRTLMKDELFSVNGQKLYPNKVWPSKNLKKILIATDVESNWRHSFIAKYWVFDVETQTAEALDPDSPHGRVQLAVWSPQSDAIAFTRDNNLFLRQLSSATVTQITKDGGSEYFYGIPDWVYEEEVFEGNTATWFSEDGKYLAFLRTNESLVPEYPIQYFLSRPSGTDPLPDEENYPEVREIKYPKAGAPNPTVDLLFYDVAKGDTFEIKTDDGLPADRLITEVLWAGSTGQALIRETNRESDVLNIVLVDVPGRTGKVVRTVNVTDIDGGWFEISENTRFIPADPDNGRPHDGYIDTVIYGNYDHLGYFTPLDNPDPILLTSGDWEVVEAPSAVDLTNNLVYFVSTKESPIQRHVYSVKLDGSDMKALTDTSTESYFEVSFSSGAGYALVDYKGPNVPWQKVMSTPSNAVPYEQVIEENKELAGMAQKYELPILNYQTINIDGFDLQLLEQRPPHFNENKKYPVLFFLYNGPGSQQVKKTFAINFQTYIAANLGYIVVTLDGRGTGYIGREARCIVRENLGHWEAHDQIEAAKMWAAKKYVDASRMAIWGWSYGGFMTLKTLEQDAGATFSYGMAVAPVTDWRFYDSVYTERYMRMPQHNPDGYEHTAITDVKALGQNVRFLVMHGVADDNVHMQNTLTLLDKLDLAGIENYDVHFFPDSDHSIYFHNANRIVYDKLENWLINAFNGEWLRTTDPHPLEIDSAAR